MERTKLLSLQRKLESGTMKQVIGHRTKIIFLLGISLMGPQTLFAQDDVAASKPGTVDESSALRFDISGYTLEGATLLTQAEIAGVVAPFIGKGKDFTDVQRALEAVEEAYSARGFSAVRVLLPEQELEKGAVRFQVMESRFGKVTVTGNRFSSTANVLNALPSVVRGGIPKSRQIAHELKFANENPARQLNVMEWTPTSQYGIKVPK